MALDIGTVQPEPPLSFQELINLSLQLNTRLDALWLRVLYSHAAIVGVMVFFANSANPFLIPRFLVFGFYSVNTVITIVAFREVYRGLRAAVSDLREMSEHNQKTHVQNWVFSRDYDNHSTFRVFVLVITWAILGYILIYPMWGGVF